MAIQPAIARQNRRGIGLYKQLLQPQTLLLFSDEKNSLLRWLFADTGIRRWNASAAGLDLLQLADSVIPYSHPASIRSASKRAQFLYGIVANCKCRTVIVRRAGLPCADDSHTEYVSCLGKSHADAALSRAECSHCESFSLASLRSRIAFFSESDSAPRASRFLPPRDLWILKWMVQMVVQK